MHLSDTSNNFIYMYSVVVLFQFMYTLAVCLVVQLLGGIVVLVLRTQVSSTPLSVPESSYLNPAKKSVCLLFVFTFYDIFIVSILSNLLEIALFETADT